MPATSTRRLITEDEALIIDASTGEARFNALVVGPGVRGLKPVLIKEWFPRLALRAGVCGRRGGSSAARGSRIHREVACEAAVAVCGSGRSRGPLRASCSVSTFLSKRRLRTVAKEVFVKDAPSCIGTFIDMIAITEDGGPGVTVVELKTGGVSLSTGGKPCYLPHPLSAIPGTDGGFAHAQLACATAMAIDSGLFPVTDAMLVSVKASSVTGTRCLAPFLEVWSIDAVAAVGRYLLSRGTTPVTWQWREDARVSTHFVS